MNVLFKYKNMGKKNLRFQLEGSDETTQTKRFSYTQN